MKASKDLAELYLTHEHAFIRHLKKSKKLDRGQVHKLRVEVKNLRVLFEFLDVLLQKKFKGKSTLKLLKPVFKTAGEIRTAQLNQELARPYRRAVTLRFSKYLGEEEKKAGKKFLKQLRDFDAEDLKKHHRENLKQIRKIKSKHPETFSETFVRSMFAKIQTAMFDINKDEVLHEIRKHLKVIKTMAAFMDELKYASSHKNLLEKIKATYEKIGEWHDEVEFVGALEAYILKKEAVSVQKNTLSFILKLKGNNEKTKLLLSRKLKKDLV